MQDEFESHQVNGVGLLSLTEADLHHKLHLKKVQVRGGEHADRRPPPHGLTSRPCHAMSYHVMRNKVKVEQHCLSVCLLETSVLRGVPTAFFLVFGVIWVYVLVVFGFSPCHRLRHFWWPAVLAPIPCAGATYDARMDCSRALHASDDHWDKTRVGSYTALSQKMHFRIETTYCTVLGSCAAEDRTLANRGIQNDSRI